MGEKLIIGLIIGGMTGISFVSSKNNGDNLSGFQKLMLIIAGIFVISSLGYGFRFGIMAVGEILIGAFIVGFLMDSLKK